MGKLKLDLTNYRDQSSHVVPEGEYKLHVYDIVETKSKAGSPMLEVYMTIQGGEYDGLNIMDRVTVQDNTLFRVVAFLKAFGLATPRKKLQIDTARLVNKTIRALLVEGEPYKGRTKSEVAEYLPKMKTASAPAAEVEEGEDLDGLDEFTTSDEDAAAEEEPKAKKSKKSKAKAAEPEEDDDSEEIGLDDVEDIDEL